MAIGGVDMTVTKQNVQLAKKRRVESRAQAEPSTSHDADFDISCDESAMLTTHYSSDSSEASCSNESTSEDEWPSSSSKPDIISSKACALSAKKLSSYRLSQAMLDCGAELSTGTP